MKWSVYLSGEIHTDWRERIMEGAAAAGLSIKFTAPVTVHEASDDVGEAILGKEIGGVKIRHSGEIAAFVRENRIDIAILAIPKESATDVSRALKNAGIRGILNFAPLDLEMANDFTIENIHIIDKMLALSFMMKA